jgi:hypothetical protein
MDGGNVARNARQRCGFGRGQISLIPKTQLDLLREYAVGGEIDQR